MFVQNVNYFVERHRRITKPDGKASMRVLKYPTVAGNCRRVSHLFFAILQHLFHITVTHKHQINRQILICEI